MLRRILATIGVLWMLCPATAWAGLSDSQFVLMPSTAMTEDTFSAPVSSSRYQEAYIWSSITLLTGGNVRLCIQVYNDVLDSWSEIDCTAAITTTGGKIFAITPTGYDGVYEDLNVYLPARWRLFVDFLSGTSAVTGSFVVYPVGR